MLEVLPSSISIFISNLFLILCFSSFLFFFILCFSLIFFLYSHSHVTRSLFRASFLQVFFLSYLYYFFENIYFILNSGGRSSCLLALFIHFSSLLYPLIQYCALLPTCFFFNPLFSDCQPSCFFIINKIEFLLLNFFYHSSFSWFFIF